MHCKKVLLSSSYSYYTIIIYLQELASDYQQIKEAIMFYLSKRYKENIYFMEREERKENSVVGFHM